MKSITALFIAAALAPAHVATAQTKRQAYIQRVEKAPVTDSWARAVNTYTGGSYGLGLLRSMSNGVSSKKRRQPVLDAAVRYHIPLKLLIGIWGVESGYGQAWNHFGLIGPANGNLRHDAFIAARILRNLYGRDAVK